MTGLYNVVTKKIAGNIIILNKLNPFLFQYFKDVWALFYLPEDFQLLVLNLYFIIFAIFTLAIQIIGADIHNWVAYCYSICKVWRLSWGWATRAFTQLSWNKWNAQCYGAPMWENLYLASLLKGLQDTTLHTWHYKWRLGLLWEQRVSSAFTMKFSICSAP